MKLLRSRSDRHLKDGRIGSLFLDSGAHSLYSKEVIDKKHREGYKYYYSKDFIKYVDTYAAFIKKYKSAIDMYVNVDAIFNPERSWEILKYLENEHGLRPLPVIHFGADLKWIKRHIDAGYGYIGLGGLGQEVTARAYKPWGDKVFEYICPKSNNYLPIVKTHGFAMTAPELLARYPFRSVDSASWVLAGGFGQILVPHKRKDKFTFVEQPYSLSVSSRSPTVKQPGRNLCNLPLAEQKVVEEWLAIIGIARGKDGPDKKPIELGVINNHHARRTANLLFFEKLVESLPDWPWPFKRTGRRGFFNG